MGSLNDEESTVEANKPWKTIRLRSLKNGGTTIKNDSGNYEYLYNPLEVGTNPYNTKCVNGEDGFSVELSVDVLSKIVYLSDLATRAENPTTASRSSPIYADASTTLVPDGSQSLHNNAGVTISGKLKICVAQAKKAVYVRSQTVRLKCFVHEYVCLADTAKKEGSPSKRIVKMLDEGENYSKMLPYKEIKVDIGMGDEVCCLKSGTHEFSFSFHLRDFPASVSTYFGKTFYRLESVTQVVKNVNKRPWAYDTIILTDEIKVKRILSTTDLNLKHESILLQGDWDKTEINYNLVLNTKLIEIGVPFGMQFGLMRKENSTKRLDKIVVCLSQTVTIPCLDAKTTEPLKSSYSKRNEVELYEICLNVDGENAENNDNYHFYEIGNLKVPPTDNGALCENWLKPFYCELSTKYQNRARLKITHTILLKLSFSTFYGVNDSHSESADGNKSRPCATLTLKVPALLVDQGMSNNLWLPPYKKFGTGEQIFEDEPPGYYHDDSIGPPHYLTERAN